MVLPMCGHITHAGLRRLVIAEQMTCARPRLTDTNQRSLHVFKKGGCEYGRMQMRQELKFER